MADRLNRNIMDVLVQKTGKTAKQIRPRLSELRREHSGLTMNAAAQMYARSHDTSIMGKLSPDDRRSLATVQAITQVSVSNVSKVDKRSLHINNSSVLNLSFGDRTQVSQSAVTLGEALEDLHQKIEASKIIPQEQKEDFKSDIHSLASQLGKRVPSKQIIKAAWKGIQGLASINGFANLIGSIGTLIKTFL